MCPGGSKRGGRYQIISRTVQQIQSLCLYFVRIVQHIHDRCAPALLHASAALILERSDAAFLVTRAGVIVHNLIVADKILLESVQHMDRFVEHLPGNAAVHQHSLGPEHFRYFRQDRRSALPAEHVAEDTHCRVGRNSGQSVGPSAFHSDHKLIG